MNFNFIKKSFLFQILSLVLLFNSISAMEQNDAELQKAINASLKTHKKEQLNKKALKQIIDLSIETNELEKAILESISDLPYPQQIELRYEKFRPKLMPFKLFQVYDKENAKHKIKNKSKNINIKQISVLYQGYRSLPKNMCGYYAIYNAYCMLKDKKNINCREIFNKKLSLLHDAIRGMRENDTIQDLTGEEIKKLLQILLDENNISQITVMGNTEDEKSIQYKINKFKDDLSPKSQILILNTSLNTKKNTGHWFAIKISKSKIEIADSMAINRTNANEINHFYKQFKRVNTKHKKNNIKLPRINTKKIKIAPNQTTLTKSTCKNKKTRTSKLKYFVPTISLLAVIASYSAYHFYNS
ncbi:hypothetical protein ACFLYH_02220 [Candidatus Dependentiae bacterium]